MPPKLRLHAATTMHISSLKIFCDVVDRRSFSRAADDNHISQSNCSQMVQALEKRLGVQLLDRSKRPFELTPEGQRFYDGCRQIVKRYADLAGEIGAAARTYADEVRARAFPSADQTYRPKG